MPPVILTADLEAQVIERITLGEQSLRQICAELGFAHSTFILHCNENKELADRYARAKEIGDDLAFDRLRELQTEKPERGKSGVDSGWVAWRRQQIDTLKWELSKRNPKKFGDRLAHTGADGESPLTIKVDI